MKKPHNRKYMITAGIDIGSITTKVAFLENGKILGSSVDFTGYNPDKNGRRIYENLLSELGIEEGAIERIVSTGYGRNSVSFSDKAMTEILCHGAGAHFMNPSVRGIVDIGGQDSKAMVINEDGKVTDFVMNDKCAAGTGRFLEVMARALEANLDDFGKISGEAVRPAPISSTCTVFAESEVISLISKGETRENIISGIHESVATRVAALAKRISIKEPVMMTGGVAKNSGVVRALGEKLGMELIVLDSAQVIGAIGAAVMAAKELQ